MTTALGFGIWVSGVASGILLSVFVMFLVMHGGTDD